MAQRAVDAASSGPSSSLSSSATTVSEVEALIAALQASSVAWRDKKSGVARHMHYAQSLCRLQETLAVVASSRAVHSLVDRGLVVQCIAMAIEHATLGMMSWVVLRTWEAVLTDLLCRLHRVAGTTSGVAHLLPPLWATVAQLSKSSLTSRRGEAALIASQRLLAVLLQYCPVELNVVRRSLPHPIRALTEPMRTSGYTLLPWVAINAKATRGDDGVHGGSGHVASSSTASAYPFLSDDLFEYIRKGLSESKELAVRAAAVESVRVMLEAGIRLTEEISHTLLTLLVGVCEEGCPPGGSGCGSQGSTSVPRQTEQDAGMAIGYLLALCQSGHVLVSLPQVLERRDVARWLYVGGPGPAQAARVQSRLLLPSMSRSTQMALGTAMATLWRMCVTPPAMADALRLFFVLLIPTPKDSRAYMPRILVNALALWARHMPSNQHRAALVYCLRDLLRRTSEARVILHTALLGLQAVVCTLASTRQVSRGLSADLKQLAVAQPSLSGTTAEVMASLATHSPHFRRTLLQQLVAVYKRFALPSDDPAEATDGLGEEEGAFTMTTLLLSRTILSLPPALLATASLMKVLLTAVVCLASVEPPTALHDGDYRQMEYYFFFAAALLEHHRHGLSAFLLDKLASSTRMFLSLLVGHTATSPAYLRAATAACRLLLVRGDVQVADTMLGIALLEGQLLSGAPPSPPLGAATDNGAGAVSLPTAALLAKLKGGVFELVKETRWTAATTAGQIDLGSLRWAVTQALNTLDEMSLDVAGAGGSGGGTPGVEVVLTDTELLPNAVAPLLGARRPHAAAATGLPRVLAETGHHAVQLIAWAIAFFNEQDTSFCGDVVQRLAGLTEKGSRLAQWNSLCAELAVLESWHRLPPTDRQATLALQGVAGALQRWKVTALRVAQAPSVDLEERLLASKVAALLLELLGDVDAFTVTALRMTANATLWPTAVSGSGGGGYTASPTTATAASSGGATGDVAAIAQASGTLLILGHAHGAVTPPGTFSMAVSFFAESLRRTGLAGDVQCPLILSTLLGVLSLLEVHVADVQETILDALLTALTMPVQAQLDPVTHSLVVAILVELDFSSEPLASLFALTTRTAVDSAAWVASTAADVMDGRLQLLCDAVASETHQLQLPSRAAVLRHLVLHALKETTLAVPFYFPGYSIADLGTGGGGGAAGVASSTSAATASNSAKLAAARRRQGHTFRLPWALMDTTTEWIARLSAECVLVGGNGLCATIGDASRLPAEPTPPLAVATGAHASLTLSEVSVLIDAAVTEQARDVWSNVALHMVLSATPAQTTVYLQEIGRVMQARLPDLSELLKGGRRLSLTTADAVDGERPLSDDEDALGVTYGSGDLAGQLGDGLRDDADEDEHESRGHQGQRQSRLRHSMDAAEETPICGDVASKVAYMALLVAVCDRHTPRSDDTDRQHSAAGAVPPPSSMSADNSRGGSSLPVSLSTSPGAERARRDSQVKLYRQCLEVAVASVPLVEAIPELLESAVALLQQLFQPAASSPYDGTTPSSLSARHGTGAGLPSLTQWKIPLVAALKTVVQLSIFDSFPACQLVARFLACELADDTTARRVTRGLLLLLMALEHLEAESGGEFMSKDAGRVVVTLSEVLEQAVRRHWRQTAAVAAEGLGSLAGQAALAMLCRDLCCTVGLANGCEPPPDLKVPHSVAPDEGVDASVLLRAAVQLHERPGVVMGPSLRHAVGCLACLVAATDGADLAPVARLVGALSRSQQAIIAEVAWETLRASLVPTAHPPSRADVSSRSTSPHSLDPPAGDALCLISESEEQSLLDILVTSATTKPVAETAQLVDAVLPRGLTGTDITSAEDELPPPLELRALLALALQAQAPSTATVARVLQCTHVEMVRLDTSPLLVQAVIAYVTCATEGDILVIAQSSAAGCALMERACGLCARRRRHSGPVPGAEEATAFRSPLSLAVVPTAVVERLREALVDTFDPCSLVQFMWPRPAEVLDAVVVCLSVLAAESSAVLVVKAGPAMCHLFVALMEETADETVVHASLPQRLVTSLALLTKLLTDAPQAELHKVLLQPVGVALVQNVAKRHPAEMKGAIQRLGPARALVLRGFMEQSASAH